MSPASSFRDGLTRWFTRFLPSPAAPVHRERVRASIGALVGIACIGIVMRALPGVPAAVPLLVAPMGASAVLLFAVPASPLAQPWSIIGGNLVAAVVGVGCARWIPDPVAAASLAIACSISAMFALRCVHPPSGAVALTAVVGGPAIHGLGFRFVLEPVALQSAVLLGSALTYHALTGHRYPHRAARTDAGRAPQAAAPAHAGFTRGDLEAALKRQPDWLDVSPDDLETLLREVELRAYGRTFGTLACADIMSNPVLSVAPDTSRSAALALLSRHRIKALPVVDDARRVIGIVTRADLSDSRVQASRGLSRVPALAASARAPGEPDVRAVMTPHVLTVRADTPVAELVPLFADHGHHHVPVVDAEHRLAGIITQTDLIAGLHRETQLRRAA